MMSEKIRQTALSISAILFPGMLLGDGKTVTLHPGIHVPLIIISVTATVLLVRKLSSAYAVHRRTVRAESAVRGAAALAAESERPIFLVTGTGDIDDPQGLAALIFAMRFSNHATGRKQTRVFVSSPVLHRALQALQHPAPDPKNGTDIFYFPPDDTVYAAAVKQNARFRRPVSSLYFGSFGKEALLMTAFDRPVSGNRTAVTASLSQIPFFMASTDHVAAAEEPFIMPFLFGNRRDIKHLFFSIDAVRVMLMALICITALVSLYAAYSGYHRPLEILKVIVTGGQ